MERTASGAYGILPPENLLAAGNFGGSTWSNTSTSDSASKKVISFVGDGLLRVPIEVVSNPNERRCSPPNMRIKETRSKVFDEIMCVGGTTLKATPERGKRRIQKPRPALTPDFHADLKARLVALVSVCRGRAEFQRNPRSLWHFLRDLQEFCETLDIPLLDKSYRGKYCYNMLQSFLKLLPNVVGAELPLHGDLPSTGFLHFTVLIALIGVQWDFTYNSLTHKICNCASIFPGLVDCLLPADSRPGQQIDISQVARTCVSGQIPGSALTARSLGTRIDMLRRKERHFPPRLLELSLVFQKQFLAFAAQVPAFLEDLQNIPTSSVEQALRWERFVACFSSEVGVLDRYYTQFEQLYLVLVDRMIGTALEPVRGMTGPSSSLVRKAGDPFRPVEVAVLCQRLGFLKQQVCFGGAHHLVHFDPHLLVKAQRVIQMNTYEQVRSMAQEMLTKFEALCKVLVDIRDDQIQPELQENAELRGAVVDLESVWAECQFLLQQDALDFIRQLLEYLPQLNIMCRWQLRVAMQGDDANVPLEGQQAARQTFFETLPILVYLDELWCDIKLQAGGGSGTPRAAPVDLGISCNFRELFCPKTDRHHMLRRDFAKFDDLRFAKFRSFLLGEQDDESEGAGLHSRYFGNVYNQLREVAAFQPDVTPMKAMQAATTLQAEDSSDFLRSAQDEDEARSRRDKARSATESRARWVCVQRVAQNVEPELFPTERPAPQRQKSNRVSIDVPGRAENLSAHVLRNAASMDASEGSTPSSPTASRRSSKSTSQTGSRRSSRLERRNTFAAGVGRKSPKRRFSRSATNTPRGDVKVTTPSSVHD